MEIQEHLHRDLRKISAIVPCYNEENIIPVLYDRLSKALKNTGYDYEILYINDASPDNSLAVLASLAEKDQKLKVISFSRNFGIHKVFSCGFDYATGDVAFLMDGDLQDPPEMITDFIAKWKEGYDVIYGVRVKRKETLFRRIAYKLFYRVFQYLAYIPIPLDAGEFALVDRKVINAIKRFPERDRFTRGLRAWVGFRQTGIPYTRDARYAGKSTNNLFKFIYWAKLAIFSFSFKPLYVISYIAFFMVLLSIIGIVFYLIAYFQKARIPGFATSILIVLFFSGMQMFVLGIVAEYIARIFEETKQRPLYLVGHTMNIENHDQPKDFLESQKK